MARAPSHSQLQMLSGAGAMHLAWRRRFLELIERGIPGDVNAVEICRDDRCPLGEWLLAAERAPELRLRAEFLRVVTLHRQFHQQAGVVATLVAGRRYEDARSALRPGKPYEMLSAALLDALEQLLLVLAGQPDLAVDVSSTRSPAA